MLQRISLAFLLLIQLSYCTLAAESDKKTNTLKLIKTLTELPFFRDDKGFADYLPPFYTPVHIYIEDGDKSIVELRSAEQELLYRIDISYLNNYPDKLVIYRSEKTSSYNADEESPYKVVTYLDHMEVVYNEGKLSTLTYAYSEGDESTKLLMEYNLNGTLKRAYFDSVKYGGSYFEANYSGQYADSIIVFLCNKEAKLIPYSTYVSKHDGKGDLISRSVEYTDKFNHSITYSAAYDESGNLTRAYKKFYKEGSYNNTQYCWTYEYTENKLSKGVVYYESMVSAASNAEEIIKEEKITAVYYYTFNATGNMLTRRNFFQNYCMDTDITLVCTLDSKNMVIEKKTLHKSKSKCRY